MKSIPPNSSARKKLLRTSIKKVIIPRFHLRDFPGFSEKNLSDFVRYYDSQMIKHHAPEKRVGWNSVDSQNIRFETFISAAPLHRRKVLDVGCGLGAFWAYLKKGRIKPRYTGVDIFPKVVQEARRTHPGAKFEVRNILSRPFPNESFDYTFLSGVFNVKIQDNWQYMKALLSSALKQTQKVVAFNVLNAEAGLKESNRFSVKPRELVSFGRQLKVSKVHLFDHYHPLDLTLFLYK
jgi:SAM-dependent methyltransferase